MFSPKKRESSIATLVASHYQRGIVEAISKKSVAHVFSKGPCSSSVLMIGTLRVSTQLSQSSHNRPISGVLVEVFYMS